MEEKTSTSLSETLLIGYFTVLAYLVSYYYEVGQREYYKFPNEFIKIDLMTILNNLTSLKLTFLLLFIYANIYVLIKPKRVRARIIVSSLFLLFGLAFLQGFDREGVVAYSSVALLIFYWGFIHPLFTNRQTKGIINKIRASSEKVEVVSPNPTTDLMSIMIRRFGSIIVVLGLSIILTSSFKYRGIQDAKSKEVYTILHNSNNSFVVFDKDQYQLLVAPVNLETNVFTPKYKYIRIQDLEKESYIEEVKIKNIQLN